MSNYYDKEGNRREEYVEDSTRGSSLVKPLNYKGDVLVQVWIDSRVLATLSLWLEKSGSYARYMSEVVREPLYTLAEFLADKGSVEMIEDTVEARVMLERRYRVNLNRGQRGGKNVLHNQVLSDKRGELGERVRDGSKFSDVQVVPRKRAHEELVNRATSEYRRIEVEEEEKRVRLETQRAIYEARKRGELARPGEGIREGMSREELDEYDERREREEREKLSAPIDEEFLRKGLVKE